MQPLPPGGAPGALVVGHLRLQVFLTQQDLAEPLRLNVRFGGDEGEGSWAEFDPVAGAVLSFPLVGSAEGLARHLRAAAHATLTFTTVQGLVLGRALVDCTANASEAPRPSRGALLPAHSGGVVDASWRLSLWAAEEAAPARRSKLAQPAEGPPPGGAWLDRLVWSPAAVEARDRTRVAATALLLLSLALSPGSGAAAQLGTPCAPALQLLRPAPYAFSVAWPLLHVLLAALGLFQTAPSQRGAPLPRRCGWAAARALASLSLWSALSAAAAAQRGAPPSYAAKLARAAVALALAAALLATLASLLAATASLAGHPRAFRPLESCCLVAPLSLLCGWTLTLAPGNSLSALMALAALGHVQPPPVRGAAAALTAALCGLGATLAVLRGRGNPWLAGGAAWGLAGLAVHNTQRGVRDQLARSPGEALRADPPVVFTASVAAATVLAAAAVRCAFAQRRLWAPRTGIVRAAYACVRALRAGSVALEV